MNEIRGLHHRAMELAEAAELARLQGESQNAINLLRDAFQFEKEAASLCTSDLALEPTRSVLHKSAAALALDCREFREAERLIAVALSGTPPDEIAEELRDLLEQVHFERHLSLRGIALAPEEVQISIAGHAVGHGMALTDEFVGRIQAFESLVFRTAERKLGKAYRESGAAHKSIRNDFGIYISVPRAASFAVSLRLGELEQSTLPFPDVPPVSVFIDDIMDGLEKLNKGQVQAVQEKIHDAAYFRNFVGLARKLAPDGFHVRLVGLTVVQHGKKRELALERPRVEIPGIRLDEPASVRVTVTGTLKYADNTRTTGRIKIIDSLKKAHTIVVPEGMMSDIVRPLWDYIVTVSGTKLGNEILLEDISAASGEISAPV
jgi:hypothetical protein